MLIIKAVHISDLHTGYAWMSLKCIEFIIQPSNMKRDTKIKVVKELLA